MKPIAGKFAAGFKSTMPRPKIDESAERERILKAAEALLRRTRNPSLSVQDVARECGMTPSNAYRFFKNKKDLIGFLAMRWFAEIDAALDRIVTQEPDPETALRAFIETQFRMKTARYDADPDLFRAYLALADRNPEAIQVHVQTIRCQFNRVVERFLGSVGLTDVDPGEMARVLEDMTVCYRVPHLIALDRSARTPERLEVILDMAIASLVVSGTPQ